MKTFKTRLLALAVAPAAALATPAMAHNHAGAAAPTATYAPITVAEVEAAQQAWGQALVAIATEYDTKGHAAAKKVAEQVLDSAYGYGMGPVLFKPTLTVTPQTFRTSRDGALAYFVGGDKTYPNDSGFALKGWRTFKIDNAGVVVTGNSAISMGNVTIWDAKGNMTKVDKTWGYVRGGDGKLRIVLHHSSLPYSPK
ncbi:phosphoribosyl-AMP cyclohydrolase [Novosphingobium sp. TH158]|uniref:phosphoribosyl-AMP cyclohydrolase n=1 Tax=Novosphingobium sp. TH158 TaxID=2067455 RepID=UPI000C7B0417|nr:phosphoribosyl-AMP cyclohydrolase [Novosphingobium sp. TH158]PLK27500.1 phosphoribosyl-AMP cyclohydrolase [Novosphingobium sp. TH158]